MNIKRLIISSCKKLFSKFKKKFKKLQKKEEKKEKDTINKQKIVFEKQNNETNKLVFDGSGLKPIEIHDILKKIKEDISNYEYKKEEKYTLEIKNLSSKQSSLYEGFLMMTLKEACKKEITFKGYKLVKKHNLSSEKEFRLDQKVKKIVNDIANPPINLAQKSLSNRSEQLNDEKDKKEASKNEAHLESERLRKKIIRQFIFNNPVTSLGSQKKEKPSFKNTSKRKTNSQRKRFINKY